NISLLAEEEVGSRAARIQRASVPPHNVEAMPAPTGDPVAAAADARAQDVRSPSELAEMEGLWEGTEH
ncbi:unnamed protein product, partial [Closterium sp. Naga37s-1]